MGKDNLGKGMLGKGMVGKGMVGKGMVGKGMVGKGMVGKGIQSPVRPHSLAPHSFASSRLLVAIPGNDGGKVRSKASGHGLAVGLGRQLVGNAYPGAASMLAPLARTGPGLRTVARSAGCVRPRTGLEQLHNDPRELV
jgi:hypothetical protein